MNRLAWTAAFGLIALSLAAPGWPAVKLDQRKALTSEAAKQIAAAALKVATANQYKVTIVIVDEGGHLLYLERMDDSNPSGVDTASAKATAAVMYKQPTKNFADRLAHGEMLVLKLPGAMPVEGGFPLVVEGKVIGGISVGGAPKGQLDAQVAQAGVDWLAANLK